MAHSLPDYAFEGMGDDLLFDRAALGSVVFAHPRSAGWQDPELSGVTDFFKKVGKGVGNVGKAVGKGVVNAAASKVGLGPLFGGTTASIVTHQPGALVAPPPPAKNYTPFIIGGAALAVLGLVVIARRK